MQMQYVPLCIQNHVSKHVCVSKECNLDPFICPLQNCANCQQNHQECQKQQLQNALHSFKQRGKGCKQFQLMIDAVIVTLQSMVKKLASQITYFGSIKDSIGFDEQQLKFSKYLKDRREREADLGLIKNSLRKKGGENAYDISQDIVDAIRNDLSDKFQKLMKFKMLNQKEISSQTLKKTFRVPQSIQEIENEKKELKDALMQEGKIMTFWTFKLDNLKNITEETTLEEIDYLKMVSLKGWSFRKLQLIGRYLPNLKELRIVKCKLDDADAVMIASSKHLGSLETLNLHQNKITGYGGLRVASALKNNTNLFLGQNPITEDAKKRIMEVMPKTQWVLPWTFNLSY